MSKSMQTATTDIPPLCHVDMDNLADRDPDELFRAGIFFLKRRDLRVAEKAFKTALKIKPLDPRYLSYLGVCLAMLDKTATEAAILCEEAAREVHDDVDLYCNLGRVHLLFGNRYEAYRAFKRGLAVDQRSRIILRELHKMGVRKQPVFPFLRRKNLVNICAGKLLSRLGRR